MSAVSLSDVFVALSNRLRERNAIASRHLTLSYEDMIARAARSARELRERGVRPGSNVGIASRDGGETIVLMIAVWMLGATAVPMDFRTRPGERAARAREFDLVTIVEDRSFPGVPDYTSVLADRSWTDLIARHDRRPLFHGGPPAPALITLSSGTTGAPMGFVFDHERLLALFLCGLETCIVKIGERMLSAIPLSYPGSRNRTLAALLQGSTVFFHPPLFSAEEFAEGVLSTKATFTFAVPTIISGLLDIYGERSAPVFNDLQTFACAGAPMSGLEKKRAKAALSEHFLECYASSMCGGITISYGADIDTHADAVGRALPYVSLQIVDDNDEPLPPGEPGILRARTPGMARTIYGAGTRAGGDRIKDGWVYPGDLGLVDKDGYLTFLGRSSDMIIRAGANVHPSEVEAALAECAGVREAAVVGFAAPREGEEIAAFVVADGDVTEATLIAHCRDRLVPDKRPRKFVFVSELPRNASGKLVRKELRERLERNDAPVGSDKAG